MVHLLTLATFILGILTCALSVFIARYFYAKSREMKSDSKKLTYALSWQLVGEAIIGFGTLVFTTAAYFDVLGEWSIYTQSSIRIAMFLATSITTVHLFRVVRQLKHD